MFKIYFIFIILLILTFCGAFFIKEYIFIFWLYIFLVLILSFFFIIKIQKEYKRIILSLNRIILNDFNKQKKVNFFIKEFSNIQELLNKLNIKLRENEIKITKNNKKLKIKYIESSQIISSLCHEFKNPISIILGYCDLLNKEDTSVIARQKIQNQAKKLDAILNRLNLAIRLKNELIMPEVSNFNLNDIILDVCNNLEEKYKNKIISLKLDSINLSADKILMENVIINLIENALKYSNKQIKIILKNDELRIIDDGLGINEKQINQITKKFYRIDNNYKENSLGLGLFIVKYILRLHNIDLKIKSKVNKGSTFGFKIPKNLYRKI